MAPDVTPIERLGRPPDHASRPQRSRQKFTRIWRETAAAGVDDSSIRLRTLNFVGVGPETWTVERFERVMESLPQRHPCRGVLAVDVAGPHGLGGFDLRALLAHGDGRPARLLRGGRADGRARRRARARLDRAGAARAGASAERLGDRPDRSAIAHLASELIDSAEIVFVDTADAADVASHAAIGARAPTASTMSPSAIWPGGGWRAGARSSPSSSTAGAASSGFQICSRSRSPAVARHLERDAAHRAAGSSRASASRWPKRNARATRSRPRSTTAAAASRSSFLAAANRPRTSPKSRFGQPVAEFVVQITS